jgi:predicted ATPase/predicted Ser/Thr protein kinase
MTDSGELPGQWDDQLDASELEKGTRYVGTGEGLGRSLRIGNRFEVADLERDLLGRGGMGEVYRGIDLQTGAVASDPEVVARFAREGEALRQLNHPNIVHMVAAVYAGGRHYLVMEYVPGGSLRDLLEQGERLSVQRTVEIALDVADALTRAHRLGIIHRDLKPANVLLAEDGTPRLTDFGLARVVGGDRLTQTGTVVGTILYLSPEACSGQALDARADIWSFGTMLYEMLTGESPFAGDTLAAVVTAILTQPVPDLSRVRPDAPDALADLVYRMLQKDRQQRIPSVRLVGAELEAILEGRRSKAPGGQVGMQERAAPLTSRFATPTLLTEARNLPVQVTPFVGREAELAELDRLLSDPDVRLVTVLGAGGMGKTRLALQAAEAQAERAPGDRFPNGVYFVSLAPLRSTEAIVPTIAEALGFTFYAAAGGGAAAAPRQQLLDYLRQKQMLLFLDNWEHLLDGDGAADLVTDILTTAPDVRILATSRARLNVGGEQLFHLAGMEYPDWETPTDALEYSAVKLFMQSARRVRPDFELEADDLKYGSRICRLVQGMPLGILLAAAWVEMLSPQEIAAEVEGQMTGLGLDFLRTNRRDVPERQRSMRAVFDHSWSLLPERQQGVMQALSVFRGGFDREAAQQVSGASLWELMALVNRSLLHRAPTGRYTIHELLRQYAAEKLACWPEIEKAVRDRHASHYAAALQRWGQDVKGPQRPAALAEMDVEVDNARAAWDWAVERVQVQQLDRAIEGLGWFYEVRLRFPEGDTALRAAADMFAAQERCTKLSADGLRVWAQALVWQGGFSLYLGRAEIARQLLRRSLALLEDSRLDTLDVRRTRAFVLYTKGMAANTWGDRLAATEPLEQSLALYQALGCRYEMARTLVL